MRFHHFPDFPLCKQRRAARRLREPVRPRAGCCLIPQQRRPCPRCFTAFKVPCSCVPQVQTVLPARIVFPMVAKSGSTRHKSRNRRLVRRMAERARPKIQPQATSRITAPMRRIPIARGKRRTNRRRGRYFQAVRKEMPPPRPAGQRRRTFPAPSAFRASIIDPRHSIQL